MRLDLISAATIARFAPRLREQFRGDGATLLLDSVGKRRLS
jgi:hypothetical protein